MAERIDKMQEVLDRLDHKIDGYKERVVKYEAKLQKKKLTRLYRK